MLTSSQKQKTRGTRTSYTKHRISFSKTRKSHITTKKSLSSVVWVNIVAVFILIVGVFGYVVQIALSTTGGYVINDLRSERLVYNNEVAKAEIKVQKLRSTSYVAESAQFLEMVVADQAEFLPPMSTGVALR